MVSILNDGKALPNAPATCDAPAPAPLPPLARLYEGEKRGGIQHAKTVAVGALEAVREHEEGGPPGNVLEEGQEEAAVRNQKGEDDHAGLRK